MKTTKHFALTALLVLGTTLSASTPAQAQVDVGTIDLMNTGFLPGASGQATLSDVVYEGDTFYFESRIPMYVHRYVYTGYLTLTCQGLKPGGKYVTALGTFTAARDGTLSCSGSVSWFDDFASPYGWDAYYLGGGLDVSVLNSGNKRVVLSGWFGHPYW
jgi:hypothetical protein